MPSTQRPAYRRLLSRLRTARKAAGLTQAEAARRLRRPQSYLSKVETGERRIDAVELAEFATLYGTTVGALLGEEG